MSSGTFEITKVNDEQRVVSGWALICTNADGQYIVDYDDDIVPESELERAVHKIFSKGGGTGRGGDMHETMGTSDVVESFMLTQEKREKFGFGKGPSGWMVSLKIRDDEVWKKVKSGERLEFSFKCSARREPLGA